MELVSDPVAGAMRALPPQCTGLLRQAVAVWQRDEGVPAVGVTGPVAAGPADRASDLDLTVTLADGAERGFSADWPTWRAAVADLVLARAVGPDRVWTMGTSEWLRWDVLAEPAAALAAPVASPRLAAWDPAGIAARLTVIRDPAAPSADRVEGMVREPFRVTAMPEAITVRQDWLLAIMHLDHLRELTRRLLEEGHRSLPPHGVERSSSVPTPAERSVLAALPTAADTPARLPAAHLALCQVFPPAAEALMAQVGRPWPRAIEQAATRHILAQWGVAVPYPRHAP